MVRRPNRVITGAHYGLRDWLAQRVTAVLMALYTVFVVLFIILHDPVGYDDMRLLFNNQWMQIVSSLFFAALCWHAWVGVRNVLMDYVHPMAVRLTIQIMAIAALLFYFVWFMHILWS
ncbi:MAG: succinate dehydrogenase, hydrophobic membrane anchor protein [Nitrosomonas sp.]|nr:succinate dehydrogenase, hydrophobic membrane anchor protein [Nitrosomonas sp.]